jgi:RNA polymerase sigma factor (sigma-70 family)
MAGGLVSVLERLKHGGDASDLELLRQFVACRDEAAFARLVRRHGGMVFAVCRRIICDYQLAEDAFQATFLVLARKAASFGPGDSLGGWLHGVAYHSALRARAMVERRRSFEASVNDASQPMVAAAENNDWLPLLDRELQLLPRKYRDAIVLSHLQERSRKDAARELGISEGTLSSRLARGRTLLAKRLLRRGLSAPGLSVMTIEGVKAGDLPPTLVLSTAKAAALNTANQAAHISESALFLMRDAMKATLLNRLKLVSFGILIAGCCTFLGIGWSTYNQSRAQQPEPGRTQSRSPLPTADHLLAAAEFRPFVPPPAAKEPPWQVEFRRFYALRDQEIIRRVEPPYPDCRAEYFREQIRQFYKGTRGGPSDAELRKDYADYFTAFGWKDDWIDGRHISHVVPIKPEVGVSLAQAIHLITGFGPMRTEGEKSLLERKVTGDFVVLEGADPEKLAAELAKILRKKCDLPVSLTFADVERNVYVLSGKYEAKPLPDRKKNQIEVYATELSERNTGGGGGGTLLEMTQHIEEFIEAPVVLGEITGAPKSLQWHYNYRSPFTEEQRASDRNPDAVLMNFSAQTGLNSKLEKRKVKTLVVKKAE